MKIKILKTIDSTNAALKRELKNLDSFKATAIIAHTQTQGRGQMGTSWQDIPEQSALLSVAFFPKSLQVQEQFYVSMVAALSVKATLISYGIAPIIKWPNDIFVGQKKISGILIENQLTGHQLQSVIIGIGINVNQESFSSDLQATSLFLEKKGLYSPIEIAHTCIANLEIRMEWLYAQRLSFIKRNYMEYLFGSNTWCKLKLNTDTIKLGKVVDVLPNGKVQIEFKDGQRAAFGLKEIKWM